MDAGKKDIAQGLCSIEKSLFLKEIMERSEIQGNMSRKELRKAGQIYTFVTCSYEHDDYRTIVHAIERG